MEAEPLISLPYAPMAEKAVLSAMVQRPELIASGRADGIDADCFYLPATRGFYEALTDWRRDHPAEVEVDSIGFLSWCHAERDIDGMGGIANAAEIFGYAYSLGGWSAWGAQLREMKARRMAIAAAQDMAGCADSDEAILCAKTTLEALQRAVTGHKRSITAKQAANEFLAQFASDREAGDIPGAATGIACLDAVSGGMRPGELWTVGGQTSAGKSVLMLQIAAEFIDRNEPVAVFTLEMMAGEIIGRLVSFVGRVHYGHITQPRTATQSDFPRITQAVQKLASCRMDIDATAGQTSDSILAEAERLRDAHGAMALIVVDYLQLIRGTRNRGESREEEIARASGGLKQLAKHLNCPVLTGTQLNEAGKTRESRAIAQDADTLLIIEDDGVRVAKLRNGPRGDLLPLVLDGDGQRFTHTQR